MTGQGIMVTVCAGEPVALLHLRYGEGIEMMGMNLFISYIGSNSI
jgi:hypothetical protein